MEKSARCQNSLAHGQAVRETQRKGFLFLLSPGYISHRMLNIAMRYPVRRSMPGGYHLPYELNLGINDDAAFAFIADDHGIDIQVIDLGMGIEHM